MISTFGARYIFIHLSSRPSRYARTGHEVTPLGRLESPVTAR
jgi:hypothetical protein